MSGSRVKKYIVKLSEAERNRLQELINKGKSSANRLLKARILLKADASEQGENWSDCWMVKALATSESTIRRVRRQFVEQGVDAVLKRKRSTPPALTPAFARERKTPEALVCSTLLEDYAHCVLRLLEDTWHCQAPAREARARS
jgi:hypothetical protein